MRVCQFRHDRFCFTDRLDPEGNPSGNFATYACHSSLESLHPLPTHDNRWVREMPQLEMDISAVCLSRENKDSFRCPSALKSGLCGGNRRWRSPCSRSSRDRCWAAIKRAHVVIGREFAETFSLGSVHAFLDKFSDHPDELRMIAWGAGANHLNRMFVAKSSGFIVKVVENFHVIRQESDGRNQYLIDAARLCLPQMIQNVGFQPRILRATAATLIDQFPAGLRDLKSLSHKAARFTKLLFVVRRR